MNFLDFLNGAGGLLIGLILMAFFVFLFPAVLNMLSPKEYRANQRVMRPVRELPPQEGYKVLRIRNGGKFTCFSDDVPYAEVDNESRTYSAHEHPTRENESGIYGYYTLEDAQVAVNGAQALQARGIIGSFALIKFSPRGYTVCNEKGFRCEEAGEVEMIEYYPADVSTCEERNQY